MSKSNPPKLFLKFFHWFCHKGLKKPIEGDLMELYEERVRTIGKKKADRKFIKDVLLLFRPGIIKPADGAYTLTNYGMLRNYFVTSLRFINREKVFSLMNILGLSLGIGCALVIFKILEHETSFDKHHSNYHQLYRLVNEFEQPDGNVYFSGQPHAIGTGLRNDFGISTAMSYYEKNGLIAIEDGSGDMRRFQEKEGVVFVEPQFLELFDFDWIAGDPSTALSDQGKVIVTTSSVKKYFGLSEQEAHLAVGRSLMLENEKTIYVSAVIKDLPSTSDFPFTAIFHYQDQDATNRYFYDGKSWQEYNSETNCFVLLDPDSSPEEVEDQLKGYLMKYQPEDMASMIKLRLQPLAEMHSSSTITRNYRGATVSDNKLIALGIVGLFMIITACINFINLSTAQAVKRSKEVGVRKSLGGNKIQLLIQFLVETFVITLIAAIVGILVAELLASQIETIFGYEINLSLFTGWGTIKVLGMCIVLK